MGRAILATLCLALLPAGCGGSESAETDTGTRSAPVGESRDAPQGQKAAAPGVPTSRGGDNSIQTWGAEASAAKRVEVADLVRRYLRARAERNWAEACSLLAAKLRADQGTHADGASCAKALAAFAKGARDSALRAEAQIEVLSLRVGGGYAFLIYRHPKGFWTMPLIREDGRWRLLLVTPNQIA